MSDIPISSNSPYLKRVRGARREITSSMIAKAKQLMKMVTAIQGELNGKKKVG